MWQHDKQSLLSFHMKTKVFQHVPRNTHVTQLNHVPWLVPSSCLTFRFFLILGGPKLRIAESDFIPPSEIWGVLPSSQQVDNWANYLSKYWLLPYLIFRTRLAIVQWTKIFHLLVPNIWWMLPLFFLFDLKIPTKTYKISSQECHLPRSGTPMLQCYPVYPMSPLHCTVTVIIWWLPLPRV